MQNNWIDGRAVPSDCAEEMVIMNPANEEPVNSIPKGCPADAEAAVQAARAAQPAWAALSPTERRNALRTVSARLQEHSEAIAKLLTEENGKPLAQARAEVKAAADIARSYAELVVHLRSGNEGAAAGDLMFQHRQPRGVAACIVPWNYPVVIGIENVVPNLAVGNTVVWKPSEKTPLSSRLLVERVFDNLPPGVINLVLGNGPGAGEPLVNDTNVDIVVFVGSEKTGRRIGEICGQTLKKCILELGGKDPLIVDETVDLRAAVRLAVESTYTNTGQICTATERIYVQQQLFDEFVSALTEESEKLHLGDGLEEGTNIGPLVDHLQLEKVIAHTNDATSQGAELRCGGVRLNRIGYFFPPTVLTQMTRNMLLLEEETFGPVAPVIPFDDFDEAIALANDCRYGLGAIVCTTSAPRAIKAIQELEAGTVKINTMRGKAPGATAEPFGASGLGHGYGIELMYELTRQKSVHWRGAPR